MYHQIWSLERWCQVTEEKLKWGTGEPNMDFLLIWCILHLVINGIWQCFALPRAYRGDLEEAGRKGQANMKCSWGGTLLVWVCLFIFKWKDLRPCWWTRQVTSREERETMVSEGETQHRGRQVKGLTCPCGREHFFQDEREGRKFGWWSKENWRSFGGNCGSSHQMFLIFPGK